MSSPGDETVRRPSAELDRLVALVDSSLGVASIVAQTGVRSARRTRRVASPLLRRVERLPLVRRRSQALSRTLHQRGEPVRQQAATTGLGLLDLAVPFLLEQVLRRVDLTEVVRRHVDLDRVVAGVNLDAIVARMDLDAVAARLDVDAVAARLDVDVVLDRLDLTDLALRRLNLAVLVPALLAELDLTAIAQQVIEAVDLPEIIRDSSGALTSDTVRGARLRSAAADQALGRVRDRLLPHRNGARPQAVPTPPAVPAVSTGLPKDRPFEAPERSEPS